VIHVARNRVKEPETLRSSRARIALDILADFFNLPRSERRQLQPPFDMKIWKAPDVIEALTLLFHKKCAYCESRIGITSPFDVEMFRPKWQVLARDGSTRFDGYWWLTYEWSNLYPACQSCNRAKGSRFPIAGMPAVPRAMGEALAAEEPLLVDPCADAPDEHLVFADDGSIGSLTERGTTTIQVLGLNREGLREARQRVIAQCRVEFSRLLSRKSTAGEVQDLISDSQEYAGALRQCVRTWLTQEQTAGGRPAGRPPSKAAYKSLNQITQAISATVPEISEKQRQSGVDHFSAEQREADSYSISDASSKGQYLGRARAIERIEIHNFRPIEDLSLAFAESQATGGAAVTSPDGTGAGWLMLLGENAAGKSSVLQAVALTLMGRKWRNDVLARNRLDTSRFLRDGANSGYVRVHLTGSLEPIEMTFSRKSSGFEGGSEEAVVAVLGYGSTRLLPRPGMEPHARLDFARVDNLFNAFEPLNDASAWLASLDSQAFDDVARSLRIPLQLSGNCRLLREGGRVFAELYGGRVSLEELSDGYQSVLALMTDIMRVMLKSGWETMEQAEGIVLLDEIGSHLHPRWRMRVVKNLREAFPRMQFLASTHDPLCLRGLVDGEVAVMRRDSKRRIRVVTDLPPVRGLRADQLLTSEFFGLSSTIDPELEDLFTEYYILLGLVKPTPAQKQRIAEIKVRLEPFRVLGDNRRERLMLETIDEFLAKERDKTPAERFQLKAATKRKLREIWDTTEPAPVPSGGQ
jgi:uncharacterized protein (TIGR02646 family)